MIHLRNVFSDAVLQRLKARLARGLVGLGLVLAIVIHGFLHPSTTMGQSAQNSLFYLFYGQAVPIYERSDVIAVQFKANSGSRDGERGLLPLYRQLEQTLQGESTSRDRTLSPSPAMDVSVTPLGDRYALVPAVSDQSNIEALRQIIQAQPYVEETVPVLTTSTAPETDADTLVLPNEIVISVDPNLSDSQRQLLFNRYHLEVVRPLQFTRDRYIVRSTTEAGLGVLNVSNQLNRVAGIQSATPNFVQSVAYRMDGYAAFTPAAMPNAETYLQQRLDRVSPIEDSPFQSSLLPLAWHLNSTPQRGRFLPRTDLHATEAWAESNGGKNVVVAVIDSLIQWDHPDLVQNLYMIDRPDAFPGEAHGWDFTSSSVVCQPDNPTLCITGDPDTRISPAELAVLAPLLQDTFQLSNTDLMQTYDWLAQELAYYLPSPSEAELADAVRGYLRDMVSAEFHGTWSAGVVAANPYRPEGLLGVAPQAKLLPVRVFGLEGEITTARLIEALGYASDRGADVINLSLGGLFLDQELTSEVFRLLDEHPNLVIVASAGNDSIDGVAFPAAVPGVVSVGATNIEGHRTFYSSYGGRLDVVAPGGELLSTLSGGILTTGGTWPDGFWAGIERPSHTWSTALDPQGYYVQVQGTSFAAPAVSGVVALMKGEDPDLSRDRIRAILHDTASYEGLNLSATELNQYRLQQSIGFTQLQDRLSGIFPLPAAVTAEEYFFGRGLVNAAAAVKAVK